MMKYIILLGALIFSTQPALACEGFKSSMDALEHAMGIEKGQSDLQTAPFQRDNYTGDQVISAPRELSLSAVNQQPVLPRTTAPIHGAAHNSHR